MNIYSNDVKNKKNDKKDEKIQLKSEFDSGLESDELLELFLLKRCG